MAITPSSNIYLLKVPLSLDNINQLTFTNKQAQFNYFSNLPSIEEDYFSYIRQNNTIQFPAHIDSILEYNYVMYQNENYTNKWFYAFITNMEYINDNLTEISIATDVWQTWQFDISFKPSFVVREMINVSEDVPGANLLPENLEKGEYKIGGTAEIDDLEPWYIVAYAEDTFGFKLNGIYSGIQYYVYSDTDLLRNFLININLAGKTNFILNIFTVPKLAFYPMQSANSSIDTDIKATPRTVTLVSTPSSLDGYTPRNQKLRTYPFMYIGFNPAGGSQTIYRYEDFQNGTPSFNMISEINPNPQIAVIPQDYRGATGNSLADISIITGYPTISWNNDVFNVWLAQNAQTINLKMNNMEENTFSNQLQNMISGSLSAINSAMSDNIIGGVTQGVNMAFNYFSANRNNEYQINQQIAEVERQQMLPNQGFFGSNNATLLGYDLFDKNIFSRYTIKYQYAERIDKYFDMFGYATNKVKTPNIHNRPNWNYVKLINANITGNIPQADLEQIKSFFNVGMTLWHNPNNFLNYSANNR